MLLWHLMSSQTRLPDFQTATGTASLEHPLLLTTLQNFQTTLFSNGDQMPPGPRIYFHLSTSSISVHTRLRM